MHSVPSTKTKASTRWYAYGRKEKHQIKKKILKKIQRRLGQLIFEKVNNNRKKIK